MKEKCGVEIERKYIIALPEPAGLSVLPEYTVSKIEQTYLDAPVGVTHRVRRRDYGSRVEFFETKKLRLDKMSSVEEEREISKEEYLELLKATKDGTHTIRKTRHTFVYQSQCFEIDVYPEWKRTAILETELRDREERVAFPPFIRVVREVTGIKDYSNASMSHAFPDEDEVES